jgi:predicted NBD/HSP70 family sugar kinase
MPDTNGESQRLKGRTYAETRSAVLDLIRSEGEISRSQIARRSALIEKTISGIVKSLIDCGVIVEAGYAKSTGGKRPVLLRLNDKDMYAVGVTFDVARCLVVLCAINGTEIGRSELRGTGTEQPAAVLKRIAAALQRLLQRRDIDKTSIVGICVAMGGRRGTPEGWHVNAPWVDLWEPFPTEDELARLTGISVSRENDANCAALGEYWTTGKSSRDFVTFYQAYGIGCGIVVGGSIYRGSSGNADEIGHTLADPAGQDCWCGRRGCLHTVASPRAVTDLIARTPGLAKAGSPRRWTSERFISLRRSRAQRGSCR